MLTLERGRGWSIYSLGGVKRYMGFGPLLCADRRSRMSGHRAGCPGLQEGPDVRAGVDAFCDECRMSGLAGWAGCPGHGQMSRPCSTSVAGLLLLLTSSGAGCLGQGRMSGACRLSPVPLVMLLHPCTWGLVHHPEHLREGLLGT